MSRAPLLGWRVPALGVAALLLLAGCGSTPPAPVPVAPAPAASPPPPPPPPAAPEWPQAGGEVIGRGERLLIYRPQAGDTLRGVAARLLGRAELDWTIAEANGALRQPEAGVPLIVPLAPLNPLGVGTDQLQTVPILCYHRFGNGASKMSMSPAHFAAQLEWLARNDYHVVRLAELEGFLAGKRALPRRSVVITIDDGYESVHRLAFPLLKRYGFAATLFVYTDFIGAGDGLSWAQLQEMAQSGLVDVQAHSKSHRNLIERGAGETDARYAQAIEAEVRGPHDLIEKRLTSAQVKHFAYPYGDANEWVLDSLQRNKYQLGVTVHPGGNAFFAQPLLLRRTMIFGDLDLEGFKARLQTSRSVAAP